MSLLLGGCTFGFLHICDLEQAVSVLAEHGVQTFELTTASPHAQCDDIDAQRLAEMRQLFARLGLHCISLNPSFVDLNLISTNAAFRALTIAQMRRNLEIASELESEFVVAIPGRRHVLQPVPMADGIVLIEDAIGELAAVAARLGVTLLLENNPYGFLGTSAELVHLVGRLDSPAVRIAYDVANAHGHEDPSDGLRLVAPHLALVHVSDTWADRWAHTAIGRGEVDFGRFAKTLAEIGFDGTTIYELADGEDPRPHLSADLRALCAAGWQL